MIEFVQEYLSFFEGSPVLYTVAAIIVLVVFSVFLYVLFKQILLRVVRKVLSMSSISGIGYELIDRVASRLANVMPATAFTQGVHWVPNMFPALATVIHNVAAAFIVLTLARAVTGGLDIVNALYNIRQNSIERPIRGYIQLLKLAVYLIAIILMVSVLFDKSPILLLSGLGAMAAVLMLVFQDTLLSLVASIQISANGSVRVGDWIEMPSLNTDGTVVDMALHTVKVQNLDRSVTTFPVRRLVTDPFKNWRGMQESGGRRMKRALYIDQSSIHFLTDQEYLQIRQIPLLKDWLLEKEKNSIGRDDLAHIGQLTNISVFRAYVEQYLYTHTNVDQKDTILVRQMDPGVTGLPIEIYCFITTVEWNRYESIQADIIDHIYAILPRFGLFIYQQPSGKDMEALNLILNRKM